MIIVGKNKAEVYFLNLIGRSSYGRKRSGISPFEMVIKKGFDRIVCQFKIVSTILSLLSDG